MPSESEANEGRNTFLIFRIFRKKFLKNKGAQFVFLYFQIFENVTAPHQSTTLTASPRGEATKWLSIFAEENFVSKIFSRQGETTKRLTIFAEKNEVY